MHCNELIEIVRKSEDVFAELGLTNAPALTVAASAYARILPDPDMTFYEQCAKFLRVIEILGQLRRGLDPRCDSCKAEAELEAALRAGRQKFAERMQ
jgi:hypothetical protein